MVPADRLVRLGHDGFDVKARIRKQSLEAWDGKVRSSEKDDRIGHNVMYIVQRRKKNKKPLQVKRRGESD